MPATSILNQIFIQGGVFSFFQDFAKSYFQEFVPILMIQRLWGAIAQLQVGIKIGDPNIGPPPRSLSGLAKTTQRSRGWSNVGILGSRGFDF